MESDITWFKVKGIVINFSKKLSFLKNKNFNHRKKLEKLKINSIPTMLKNSF